MGKAEKPAGPSPPQQRGALESHGWTGVTGRTGTGGTGSDVYEPDRLPYDDTIVWRTRTVALVCNAAAA